MAPIQHQNKREEAINALEDSIKKNNEDQTKQVTTIGWAGMIFLVSMNAERLAGLDIYTKIVTIIVIILFNLALILEYLVCFSSIRSSEYLGLEDDDNKRKGLIWYNFARKIRGVRDIDFLLAMFFLAITIIMIIMQSMENKKSEEVLNESHINSPAIVNKAIALEIQKTSEDIQVNLSNITSPAIVNLSVRDTNSKEGDEK